MKQDSKIKFYRFIKSIKNILMMAGVFCVSAIIISFVYNYSANKVINNEVLKLSENDVENMAVLMDRIINETDQISRGLLANYSINKYIVTGDKHEIIASAANSVSDKISSYRYVYDYIHSIYIYSGSANRIWINGTNDIPLTVDDADDNWLEKYSEMGAALLFARKMNDTYPFVLTFLRKISIDGVKGAILINIDIEELSDIIGDEKQDYREKYIIDENNNVIYKNGIRRLDENINCFISYEPDKTNYIYKPNKYTYAVAVKKLNINDYKCIIKNKIDSSLIGETRTYTILIIFIITLIGIVASVFINKIVSNPIKKLVKFVNNTNVIENDVEFGSEDVTYIASKFIKEMAKNSELKKEIVTQSENLDKLKKYALGMQINPHFISNTLNLVHLRLIEKYGINYDDGNLFYNFSKCISYIVRNNDDLVTISEELSYSDMFAKILEEKSDHEVKIDIYVDNSVDLNAKIIKLCLNTLIENAFYHGISKRSDGKGNIYCNLLQKDGIIVCTVEDDGVGMTPEEVLQVEQNLKECEINKINIGLTNIQSRIHLIFGEEYGLKLDTVFNKGTKITVTIPYII